MQFNHSFIKVLVVGYLGFSLAACSTESVIKSSGDSFSPKKCWSTLQSAANLADSLSMLVLTKIGGLKARPEPLPHVSIYSSDDANQPSSYEGESVGVLPLTAKGYGELSIGLKVNNIPLIFAGGDQQFEESFRLASLSRACIYARLPTTEKSPFFMIVQGVIARIDVRDQAIPLENGLSVGSSAFDIQATYGEDQVEVFANKYDVHSNDYLVTLAPDRALVFELQDNVVTRFRVGRMPEVGWVEGCV